MELMAARGYWRRWAYTIVTVDGQQFNAATADKAIKIAKQHEGSKAYESLGTYKQIWPVEQESK
jgi:hypothetical protein